MKNADILARFDNPYPPGSDMAALAETLIVRSARGTYHRFSSQVAQANYCAAPIRLEGRITARDAAGKSTTTYTTANEPDGVILKACRNRRQSACPSCASRYRSDARHIVKSGLVGGKGMAQSIAEHPSIFATFTAPSFGAVHRKSKDGKSRCHPGNPTSRCSHGIPTACFASHDDTDAAIGTPICPKCYDYTTAVLFNAMATTLWRYTTTYLARRLAQELNLKRADFEASYRISYSKVIEHQARGVVHVHAVIRVDGIGADGETTCPENVDAADLMAATVRAARQVGVYYPIRAKGRPLKARWGDQIDVAPLNGSTRASVAKIAAYVAKYATKSLDSSGVLDRRIKACDRRLAELPDHAARLVKTAISLSSKESCAKLNLELWANAYGYRGHWLTKSKHYSTTFRALHEARITWAKKRARQNRHVNTHGPPDEWENAHGPPDGWDDGDIPAQSHPRAPEPPESPPECKVTRRFSFRGRGYATRGDAVFARYEAEDYAESRRLGWEALADERAHFAEAVA